MEQNITPWRRAVAGDLTSAFNFARPNEAKVSLPSTIAYIPPDNVKHPDYKPAPPAEQALPVQEPGIRPARALPYELHVHESVDLSNGTVNIHFRNSGKVAAVFQVRSGDSQNGPWTYTVGTETEVSDTWDFAADNQAVYDLSVYGPNGFLRTFKGDISDGGGTNLDIRCFYDVYSCGITLEIHNRRGGIRSVRILDAYSKKTVTHRLREGESLREYWQLEASYGWYDLTVEVEPDSGFLRRLAGHLETGKDSMSDPAIGASR